MQDEKAQREEVIEATIIERLREGRNEVPTESWRFAIEVEPGESRKESFLGPRAKETAMGSTTAGDRLWTKAGTCRANPRPRK